MKTYQRDGVQNPFVSTLYDRVVLTIEFPKENLREVQALAQEIGKYQEFDIAVKKKKRSLDQNSYLWVLCDKIADAVRTTKTEVYKMAVREVGVFHDMAVLEEDVDEVDRVWRNNGIGWFTDKFDSKLDGCKRMRFYHGSSLYDSKQMSRLIDYVIAEATELGIPVVSDEELEMMKNWG